MSSDKDELLEFATKTAVYVGDQLAKLQTLRSGEIKIKADNTLQTKSDLWANEEYSKRIKEAYPDHVLITEEGTWELDLEEGVTYWIIDPLDGTTNYQNGSPIYGTSVAVYLGSKPLVGVLYMPATKTLRVTGTAVSNVRGAPLKDYISKHEVIFDRGDLHAGDNNTLLQKVTSALLENTRTLRMFGSATYSLMAIAEGYDCFVGCQMKLYDVAAGVIIAKEAGLSVTDFEGNEWTPKVRSDLLITMRESREKYVEILRSIK